MSLNEWWKRTEAEVFGTVANRIPNLGVTSLSQLLGPDFTRTPIGKARCVTSVQCPSGSACINGLCIQTYTVTSGGSGGGSNTPGDCDPDNDNNSCNTGGPTSCSQRPNCGDIPNPRPGDCCSGQRCCYELNGRVQCECGPCDHERPNSGTGASCSSFCTNFVQANGFLPDSCSSDSVCDSCTFCEGSCKPKAFPPCWCAGQKPEDPCLTCDTDRTSPGYGVFLPLDGSCSDCTSTNDVVCPNGGFLPGKTYCKRIYSVTVNGITFGGVPPDSGRVVLTSEKPHQATLEDCPPLECDGDCTDKTYCSDTTGPEGDCPPGTVCTSLGFLSAGGVDCTFRKECNVSGVNDNCKKARCNCHADCGPCQVCTGSLGCQPDPKCA